MRWLLLVIGNTLLAGSMWAQAANVSPTTTNTTGTCAANQVAWFQYLSTELRRLHLDILADRREIQQSKMQDLERELEGIRAQQHNLQEEQRAQVQQAADIEAQLTQGSLGKSEREELEAQRADLLALSPSRFGTAAAALTQREARVRERLALQEQRLQAIELQVRELSSGGQ